MLRFRNKFYSVKGGIISKLKRIFIAILCVACVGFDSALAACDTEETSTSSSSSSSSTTSSSEETSSEETSSEETSSEEETSSDEETSSEESTDENTDESTDETTASLTSDGGEYTLAQGEAVDLYVAEGGSYTITVDGEGFVYVWSDDAYSDLDEDTALGDNYLSYTTVTLSEGETITIEAQLASTVTITYNADEEDEGTTSTVTYAVNYSDSALQGYTLTASTTYYFAADGSISTTETDGIISYANYTSDKTVSVIKDSDDNSVTATVDEVDYTYALNTGGKTTSSRAYYEIDLSDYVGKTVTIYAIFTSNSSDERSSMITTAKSDSTTATTVLETATSSSQTDVQTISYTVTVSTTTTYYICASASINYYYVGVTIA